MQYLSLDAAAQRAQDRGLPYSKSTLRKHLRDGAGPRCLRFGPRSLVLPVADFDLWIEARLSEVSPEVRAEPAQIASPHQAAEPAMVGA